MLGSARRYSASAGKIRFMSQNHSRMTARGRAVWLTERLWQLAGNLPVRHVSLDSITEFKQNCWFEPGDEPTCRAVAEHARKIYAADLGFPIILSADGRLMDGGHRICKAWMLGHREIAAVQFTIDPEPDHILPEAG